MFAEGLSLIVELSVFTKNSVGPNVMVWGGAIGFRGPTLTVLSSLFEGNYADCGAPAIAASASKTFFIFNNTFLSNVCNSTCNTGQPINGTVVYDAETIAPTTASTLAISAQHCSQSTMP